MDFSIGGTNLLDFVDFDGEMVEVDWGWICFLPPQKREAFKVFLYIYIYKFLNMTKTKENSDPPKIPWWFGI